MPSAAHRQRATARGSWEIDVATGSATSLAADESAVGSLTVDGASVYWTDLVLGNIAVVAK